MSTDLNRRKSHGVKPITYAMFFLFYVSAMGVVAAITYPWGN